MTIRLLRQTTTARHFALSLGLLMPASQRSDGVDTAGAIYSNDVLAVGKHTNTRRGRFDPAGTMIYVLGRTTATWRPFKLAQPWTLTGRVVAAFDLTARFGKRNHTRCPTVSSCARVM